MFDFLSALLTKKKETSVKHTFACSNHVKHLNSKGPGGHPVALTIDDINRGYVLDTGGYRNEIVLFLRKNKTDR